MAFQDPVCSSSLQILGSKGETFLKLDPFVMQLWLHEHFAKKNMEVAIIVVQEKEKGGSNQRINAP